MGEGWKTAIFAIFAYPRLQPGGAHCHILAYYSSEYSYLSENRIKKCQHERNSSRFWSENRPKHHKCGFERDFRLGADRAHARGARSALMAAKRPLYKFLGPMTGPRRIFATGLGRSSLLHGKTKVGEGISRSAYNRSLITLITI